MRSLIELWDNKEITNKIYKENIPNAIFFREAQR